MHMQLSLSFQVYSFVHLDKQVWQHNLQYNKDKGHSPKSSPDRAVVSPFLPLQTLVTSVSRPKVCLF